MPISRRDFLAAASGLGSLRLVPPVPAAFERRAEPATDVTSLAHGVSCEGLRNVNAWQIQSSLLLVCAFGSDPVEVGGRRWRGSGLSFRHVRAEQTEHLLESSEAEFDVDYWADGRALHVIQYTYVADGHQLLPLLEHLFDVSDFPARRSLIVMLRAHPNAAERLPGALSALRAAPGGRASHMYAHFYSIRDFGLVDPYRALTELDDLRGAWWDDGEVAEHATAVRRELELLVRARGEQIA